MTVPDGQPLFGPPAAGDEVATLLGSLERQRATFAWKTAGLDSEALAARVGASAITLGGLIKHLAFVEDLKLTTMLQRRLLLRPSGRRRAGGLGRVGLTLSGGPGGRRGGRVRVRGLRGQPRGHPGEHRAKRRTPHAALMAASLNDHEWHRR